MLNLSTNKEYVFFSFYAILWMSGMDPSFIHVFFIRPFSLMTRVNSSTESVSQSLLSSVRSDGSRCPTQTVLVFGGHDPNYKIPARSDHCSVYGYSFENDTWDVVSSLPNPKVFLNVVKVKDSIYAIGHALTSSDLCSSNWSFHPYTQEWTKETELITPRKNYCTVSFQGFIYVIGGVNTKNESLSSVERYDPSTRVWEEVCPMPEPKLAACATVHKNCIWVAGGVKSASHQLSDHVYCYDPKEDKWSKKPPLRFARIQASLVSHESQLYLIGGATKPPDDHFLVSDDSIDVWDETAMKWKLKVKMVLPRHGHSAVVLNQQMLLVGGMSSKYNQPLTQVDVFSLKTGDWCRQWSPLPTTAFGQCAIIQPITNAVTVTN